MNNEPTELNNNNYNYTGIKQCHLTCSYLILKGPKY